MVSSSCYELQAEAEKIYSQSHTTVGVCHKIFLSQPSAATHRNFFGLNGLSRLTWPQVLAVDLLNPTPAAYAYFPDIVITALD